MDAKSQFFAILREEWSPLLRQHGFKGSGKAFQRRASGVIHAITVQVSKYGGSCCVGLGVHPAFMPTFLNRLIGEADKPHDADCEFRWRLTPRGFADYWWTFDRGEGALRPYGLLGERGVSTHERARHLIQTYEQFGEPRLRAMMTLDDLSRCISLDDLDGDLPPIYMYTQVRAALTMALIHEQLGNIELSRRFAQRGLRRDSRAGIVVEGLNALLSRTA